MNFAVIISVVLVILALYVYNNTSEGYSNRGAYRYGAVDTNPERRVSDAFDSPEQKNIWKGLPLP